MRLDHTVIAVTDWERSNAFYRAVLGVEVLDVEYGRVTYVLDGDQRLNVHGPGSTPHPRAAQPVAPGNSDLCFVWEGGVDAALEHLSRNGVEVELGPVARTGARGDGTSLYFRDPDGSLLELIVYG